MIWTERPRAEGSAEGDTQQGNKGGLQQEGSLHHTLLKAQGPQHTDLLSSLHHGAGSDDPQGSNTYYQAQSHKALEQVIYHQVHAGYISDLFFQHHCLHTVL